MINIISEAGVEVIHGKINNIHTSGHGGQQEQKLMLRLIKPKYFMPVHGEYRMQKVHAGLAVDTGVEKDNIFIMSNGDVLPLLLTQLVSQVTSMPKISMSMEIVSVKSALLSSKTVEIYLKMVSF